MINIPVSDATHASIGKISRFLCFAAFLIFAALLSYSAIGGYFRSNAILKDHSLVTAPVTLQDIEEKSGRKGRKSYTYHFSYAFEAGGQARRGEFSTSEGNSIPYMDEGATVEVAYSNADPSRFERLQRLQNQSGLGGMLVRLAVALPVSALLAFIAHLLIVGRLFVARPKPAEATA
ncbi:DUF3592 domain-containing protein [Pseudoxanthomonas wuyuanensis]|uniref:DUF3592 domain-containing protein n=1 Tax=Pseudoxanthomonas wuyuanensis TaxID=1073196 RepID=A0A286CZD9_9GAMM|nr:DUF3592 domain-containing protein [Pseudoxanthomonas wuyuanensis]KAF1722333.1 DUF3592 domain-containing protein [Pseudoxanthomonas wuyuanensis]SOD51757.1 Protein of unknown function [Pseudoxanthomonas wuyuanensis]